MADVLNVLRRLINQDDVQKWADVNGYTVTESEDKYIVAGYAITFDKQGRLIDVRQRVITGNRV